MFYAFSATVAALLFGPPLAGAFIQRRRRLASLAAVSASRQAPAQLWLPPAERDDQDGADLAWRTALTHRLDAIEGRLIVQLRDFERRYFRALGISPVEAELIRVVTGEIPVVRA